MTTAGTTGVRYIGDDGYYLSRNQAAVLEVGDQIYSNCRGRAHLISGSGAAPVRRAGEQ